MKKVKLLFLVLSTSSIAFSNDGAFFAKGNQLIPITETDITVKKEILTLKKVRNQYIEVTVYYEFFNPKETKNITVGFEAFQPMGDVDSEPKNGQHPYIRDFTVELNNQILKYDIAYVSDTLYNNNGKINGVDLAKFERETSDGDYSFFYVYHFNATFKKGLNTIKHTYNYTASHSIGYNYELGYVLTAAKRWGNKQIDDFTLLIDNGEFETFSIPKTFFKNSSEWLINGIGKTENVKSDFIGDDELQFHIQKGNIIFQKTNFNPNGELFLYAHNFFGIEDLSYLPFSYYQADYISEPQNEFQKKLLKNLPFARRGYVFQNVELKNYFEKMNWYIPNPNYTPNVSMLTDEEKKWLEKWK